jgi:hypothetical protein
MDAYAASKIDSNVTLSLSEQQAIEGLKKTLLDSLIFYDDVSAQLGKGIGNVTDAIVGQANDVLHTFTLKNNLDIDTPTGIINFMKQDNFETLVKQAFDQFMQQAASTDSTTSMVGKLTASAWANKLYLGMGYVYMIDFLGGIDAKVWTYLTTEVKGEVQAFQADPTQYI